MYPNDYFEPDNSQCNYNEITVYYMLIKFLYINVGIKDNPQRRIVRVECQSFSKNDDLNNDSIYLEILFIQYDGGLKTKEAKAPSIFVLPKNVLYPFRFTFLFSFFFYNLNIFSFFILIIFCFFII